ncbi:MAG: TonB-dependent receptor [Minicystis sp.]
MLKTLRWKRGLGAAAWLGCRAGILLPAGAVALAAVLTSSAAVAQGAGVLTGTVRDASTKAALADIVVTATSPALQGEQTVVTDGSGQYRIPNLPPGEYTLRFDRDSYRPGSRGGISMRASSTIRVGYELLPEQVTLKAEEVVVVSKAPTVDVGSSSTGVSLNQDFTNRLPLSSGNATRSFESLATVAPGAQANRYGVSISGTTSPENAFVINGVGVNSPAYGTLATPLSVEFVKEVNVVSGGYMPEYGRAMGGIFDVTTQSGSNEFHGSVFFNITPGALEGPRREVKRDGTTISTNPGLGSLRDFGATLGGPILKDRLWFFGGLQAAFTRNTLERTLNEIPSSTR